jgi:Tfp pilus assembly protein PilN
MKTPQLILAVLSFAIVIFILFAYMPSKIQLSGLENERQILEKLLEKEIEIEHRLFQEKDKLEVKLAALEARLQKQISTTLQDTQKQTAVKKKTPGNRGFLFKKKK